MMIRFLPAAAIALSLAACSFGTSDPADAPKLHLACQTIQCECVENVDSLFKSGKKTEIVWKKNGEPTCPAGYLLKRADVDFLGRPKK